MKTLDLQTKNQSLELKGLQRKLQRQISNNENEIKSMSDFHQERKSLINADSRVNLEILRDNNQERLNDENQRYEDKIQSYSDKLSNIQTAISKEESILKSAKNNQLQDLKNELDSDFEARKQNTIDNHRERSNTLKDTVSQNNENTKQEKIKIQDSSRREIQSFSAEESNKITNNKQHYQKINSALVKQQETEMKALESQLKSERKINDDKNKKASLTIDETNQQALNFKQKYHQNQMQQIDGDFKIKYENMAKTHNEMLQNMSDRLDDDLKKAIEKNRNEKGIIENKSQDEFYRVSVLRPKVEDHPDEVIVSLPVAAHEKSNVFLSTEQRNIKITLTRNYSDQIKEADESVNKSTRSELFSKELTHKDILNPRNITQKYENGILSFRILKA